MGERMKTVCRVLTGPTGSGKSDIAMRMAAEYGWDILCMDSMQIYRRMDIGTAKPTKDDRRKVRHYLLDIREPDENFSVSDYVEEAEKKIRELHDQGREFLFVGGTGLYLQALMHPMGMGNVPADEALREELRRLADQPCGREALHDRLERLDPETAGRLPLNDVRRIIRAIEVTEATGIPFSRQPDRNTATEFDWKVVSTAMDRNILYQKINNRVNRMIEQGLKEEVAGLLREGVPENAQSMNALGYKEMIPCVRGLTDIREAAETIKTGSRHYAKRQMTFLRREPDVRYVDVTLPDAYDQICQILN